MDRNDFFAKALASDRAIMTVMHKLDGRYVYVDEGAFQSNGIDARSFYGLHWQDLTPTADHDREILAINRVIYTEQSVYLATQRIINGQPKPFVHCISAVRSRGGSLLLLRQGLENNAPVTGSRAYAKAVISQKLDELVALAEASHQADLLQYVLGMASGAAKENETQGVGA